MRCWRRRGLWLGLECIPFPRLTFSLALAEKKTEHINEAEGTGVKGRPFPLFACSNTRLPLQTRRACRSAILANMGQVPYKLEPV